MTPTEHLKLSIAGFTFISVFLLNSLKVMFKICLCSFIILQDSVSTLNSTYNLAEDALLNDTKQTDRKTAEKDDRNETTKKRKSKRTMDPQKSGILHKLIDSKDIRSSDEFELPAVQQKASTSSMSSISESSSSTLGGLKKKRKLGSTKGSFFAPVE